MIYSTMYCCQNQQMLQFDDSVDIAHYFFYLCPLQSADENLNFEEQILEAAKNIAGATSALVKSATAAQRELVAQGKLSSNPQSEDGQWSEGLVSAVSYTYYRDGR